MNHLTDRTLLAILSMVTGDSIVGSGSSDTKLLVDGPLYTIVMHTAYNLMIIRLKLKDSISSLGVGGSADTCITL